MFVKPSKKSSFRGAISKTKETLGTCYIFIRYIIGGERKLKTPIDIDIYISYLQHGGLVSILNIYIIMTSTLVYIFEKLILIS